jgi:hypothetical protein
MKVRNFIAPGLLVIALAIASQVQAAPVVGAQSKVENGCVGVFRLFFGFDCSYNGSDPVGVFTGGSTPFNTWIGPIAGPQFFEPGDISDPSDINLPIPRKSLLISGDLTVDQAGSLSGFIDIAAGSRLAACGQGCESWESWDNIRHTVPASAPVTVSANLAGGNDYQYSTIGQPVLLTPCPPGPPCFGGNFSGETFPSSTASISIPGNPLIAWAQNLAQDGPLVPTPGLSRAEGFPVPFFQNIGIQTSAVVTNYNCIGEVFGSPNPSACASAITYEGGTSAQYDNMHVAISTNAAGTIISGQAVFAHEYGAILPVIPGFPGAAPFFSDSWTGGTFTFSNIEVQVRGGEGAKIQIDKKNILTVVILGSAGFDVTTIDPASLQFGTASVTSGPVHDGGHIADVTGDGFADLTGHYASDLSDLRCGERTAFLSGTSGGIAFSLPVRYEGIGKACREPVIP